MELKVAENGILMVDDGHIIFKNFAGKMTAYNAEGNRNYALSIPTREMADALARDGWNVKIKDGVNPGDEPRMHLPVKVKFGRSGPNIYLTSGKNRRQLTEDEVEILDRISIARVDLDIRPYDWVTQEGTKNEKRGRAAYLQNMYVEQNIDRFAQRFAEEEAPDDEDELPFK